MSSEEIFREILAAFEQANVPHMVVGSFASNLYGVGRATQDIDIVVAATPDEIRNVLSFLPNTKYHFDVDTAVQAARRKDMFNILDMQSGWKVDVIFVKPTAYHLLAFQRRTAAEIERVPLFAATAEDTILAKLDWARMGESLRQIEDVAGILEVRAGLLDRHYIEKWVKELGLTSQWDSARRLAGLE